MNAAKMRSFALRHGGLADSPDLKKVGAVDAYGVPSELAPLNFATRDGYECRVDWGNGRCHPDVWNRVRVYVSLDCISHFTDREIHQQSHSVCQDSLIGTTRRRW